MIDHDDCVNYFHITDSIVDTIVREKYFGSILRNENYYETLDPQYHSWEKSYFYRHVLRDTAMIFLGGRDDLSYKMLFDSLSVHNPGLLDLFKLSVLQRNYDLASAINSSMDVSAIWDRCGYDVNDLFLRKWEQEDYEYSQEDSVRLMEIALLTPYEGGDAVYMARIMLNLDYEAFGTPYAVPIFNENNNIEYEITVSPNPVRENFNLFYPGQESIKGVSFLLYTVNGQVVTNKNIDLMPGENLVNLDNLHSGMYFYHIKNDSNSLGKGKLCIIR